MAFPSVSKRREDAVPRDNGLRAGADVILTYWATEAAHLQ